MLQQATIDRSGRPFDVLLRESVLAPLGMSDSSFSQPLPATLQAAAARAHDQDGKPYRGGAHTYPSWRQPVCGPRRKTWPDSRSRSRTARQVATTA